MQYSIRTKYKNVNVHFGLRSFIIHYAMLSVSQHEMGARCCCLCYFIHFFFIYFEFKIIVTTINFNCFIAFYFEYTRSFFIHNKCVSTLSWKSRVSSLESRLIAQIPSLSFRHHSFVVMYLLFIFCLNKFFSFHIFIFSSWLETETVSFGLIFSWFFSCHIIFFSYSFLANDSSYAIRFLWIFSMVCSFSIALFLFLFSSSFSHSFMWWWDIYIFTRIHAHIIHSTWPKPRPINYCENKDSSCSK